MELIIEGWNKIGEGVRKFKKIYIIGRWGKELGSIIRYSRVGYKTLTNKFV